MGRAGHVGLVQRVSNPTVVGLLSARRRMAACYVQPSLRLQDTHMYLEGGGGGKRPFRLSRSGNWRGG
jgi:hypothetical protein